MPILPLQPRLLEQNPQFAVLWTDLTKTDGGKLRGDGTTAAVSKKGVDEEGIAGKLRELRIRDRRRQILARALRNAAAAAAAAVGQDEGDEEEVGEVMMTISMLVESGMTTKGLLGKEEVGALEYAGLAHEFEERIDQVATAVGKEVIREKDALANLLLLSRTTQPVPQTSKIPTTSGHHHQHARQKPSFSTKSMHRSQQQQHHQPSSSELPLPSLLLPSTPPTTAATQTHALLTTTLPPYLTLSTALLTSLTSHLDLHAHGHRTRHLKARLAHLSTVAEGMALKSAVLVGRATNAVYTPDARNALEAYARHLDGVEMGVGERIGRVRQVVGEYDGGEEGEEGRTRMKEVALRYGKLLAEEERLKVEIGRLEGRAGGSGRSGGGGVGRLLR